MDADRISNPTSIYRRSLESPSLPDNNNNNNNNVNVNGAEHHIFEELLDAEVSVNVLKLREASRLGIPSRYRAVVYRYLLGVALVDRSREMTTERSQERDFEMLQAANTQMWKPDSGRSVSVGSKGNDKHGIEPNAFYVKPRDGSTVPLILLHESASANYIRNAARGTADTYAAWEKAVSSIRHSEPYAGSDARWASMSATLSALQTMYSWASPEEIDRITALTIPFDAIHPNPRDVFYCTQMMYSLLTHNGNILQSAQTIQSHCGTFLMLFRNVNAVLYQHFYVEGLTTLEWVPGMLTTLLAGKLQHADLFRLWDYYLADIPDALNFSVHPFVCLAILADMTEDLLECEKVEILYRLNSLPRVDASALLQKAIAIREEVFAKRLLPN